MRAYLANGSGLRRTRKAVCQEAKWLACSSRKREMLFGA